MSPGLRWLLIAALLAGCRDEPPSPAHAATGCKTWWACGVHGLCTERDGRCVATSDADCARSTTCRDPDERRCVARGGFCIPTANVQGGCAKTSACRHSATCTAVAGACQPSAADCRKGRLCEEIGYCTLHEARCERGAKTAADCGAQGSRPYDPCAEEGRCAAVGGVCRATSDAACRRSAGCARSGLCTARGGYCLATRPEDCRRSKECLEEGRCTLSHGLCEATTADCRKTRSCLERKRGCKAEHGSCDLLPYIHFQF